MQKKRTLGAIPALVALPDDMQVTIDTAGGARAPRLLIPGTATFLNNLPPEVRERLPITYYTGDGQFVTPSSKRPRPVINLAADADSARLALQNLANALRNNGGACFNHPDAILGTAPHLLSDLLAGIPGVISPRTIRVEAADPDDLTENIVRASLQYPVTVRIAGMRSAAGTTVITSPAEAPAMLARIPWGGKTLYATEFVPFQDADGMYRRIRIAVVGQEAYPRHQITAPHWQARADDHDARCSGEERTLIESFATRLLPVLRERLRAIGETVALDSFGIDCSLRPDGSLLVLECNAAMSVMHDARMTHDHPASASISADDARMWAATTQRIGRALIGLLFDPTRWRHPGRGGAPQC